MLVDHSEYEQYRSLPAVYAPDEFRGRYEGRKWESRVAGIAARQRVTPRVIIGISPPRVRTSYWVGTFRVCTMAGPDSSVLSA